MKLTIRKIWTAKNLSVYEYMYLLVKITKIFMVIYCLKIDSISLISILKLPNEALLVPFIDEESEIQEFKYWAQGHTFKSKS